MRRWTPGARRRFERLGSFGRRVLPARETDAISLAMSRAFRKVGVTARTWSIRPAAGGATVEVEGSLPGNARGSLFESNVSGGM